MKSLVELILIYLLSQSFFFEISLSEASIADTLKTKRDCNNCKVVYISDSNFLNSDFNRGDDCKIGTKWIKDLKEEQYFLKKSENEWTERTENGRKYADFTEISCEYPTIMLKRQDGYVVKLTETKGFFGPNKDSLYYFTDGRWQTGLPHIDQNPMDFEDNLSIHKTYGLYKNSILSIKQQKLNTELQKYLTKSRIPSIQNIKTLLTGHTYYVQALTVLPDGSLVSDSYNNIKIWDVKNGQTIKTLTGHTRYVIALTVLPDGSLVSGSFDNTIKIWDVKNGQTIKTLTGHTDWVNALTVLPDGSLASGSSDKTIKIWDANNGQTIKTLTGHTSGVNVLTVLPDGSLVSCSGDKTIKIWDVKNGQTIKTLTGHTSDVYALTVLPDGSLASGSHDKTIKIWDGKNGQSIKTLTGHTGSIFELTVLPDGSLVSGSADETIKIWDVKNGQTIKTLTGHTGGVDALTVLPDGSLVSGSRDYTIKIWY